MLITLTHLILTATSSRPPGTPPSECRGEVVRLPSPKGAEPDFELFLCLSCRHLIPAYRTGSERWSVVNEYEAPPSLEVPDAKPTPARPGAVPKGRKSRKALA